MTDYPLSLCGVTSVTSVTANTALRSARAGPKSKLPVFEGRLAHVTQVPS